MATKPICRLVLICSALIIAPKSAVGQTQPCDPATDLPASLRCAFGVRPLSLPPLTSGQVYISDADLSRTAYATFLYANQNTVPARHRASGDSLAMKIQPLNAAGQVDLANGKIVAIAEGISNTRLEMEAFWAQFIQNNPAVNPQFQFVNLAEGGCNLICWVGKGVGAVDRQVQIALMKHSNNHGQFLNGAPKNPEPPFTTAESKTFPNHARVTQGMLKQRLLDVKAQYPNLKLLFITSRCYGGWKCSPAADDHHEPVAFEEGFSVKWLIESQIAGTDSLLKFSGPNAGAPWMAWGPYIWNKTWPQDWYQIDSAHPCAPGLTAVAKQWYDFLMQDGASRPWFRDNVKPAVPANLRASVASSNQIHLTWDPAADNSGQVKYKIFRGGALLKTTASPSYVDGSLIPGTPYCYTVSAADSAGNESAPSNQACATIIPTGVAGNSPRPLEFKLLPNHPNPFGGLAAGVKTEIRFQLPENGEVAVKIYNLFGEEIRVLAQAWYPAGDHLLRWDGKDQRGNAVANGVYFYRLRAADSINDGAGGFSRVMKMTVLR